MKIVDLVNAYCKRWSLKVIKGKLHDNSLAPLLPFIIMDCAYSEFNREIKPLKLHHKQQHLRGEWYTYYHKFNSRLFSALDEEQTNFAIDLMDEYERKVDYDMMLMRVALMNLLGGMEFKDQKIMAALLICNTIAQVAQDVWSKGNCNIYGKEDVNPELAQLRRIPRELSNTIILQPDHINPNENDAVNAAVNKFIDTTIKYLYGYDRN